MFVGCKEHQTPETDNTELWPAYDTVAERWGFINAKGDFVIPAIYRDVCNFSCGYARVWFGYDASPMFIDKKGRLQQGTYDTAGDFYYKYARIRLNDNYGLMTTSFDFSCQPIYYYLGKMSEDGLAAACLTPKYKFGYVNAKGDQKIAGVYDYASDFEDGLAIVLLGDKLGAINTDGTFVIQPFYNELIHGGNGLVFFEQNMKVGAMDKSGEVVIQPLYEDLGYCFDNKLVPARMNDKYGYISKSGAIKIAFLYDDASSFSEGYAEVFIDGQCQVIDTKGKVHIVLGENESLCTLFHNGMALVYGNNTYKYITTDNRVVYSWKNASFYPNPLGKKSSQPSMEDILEQTIHFDSRKL
ncbi:MAG: WG repeat-containing protein [Paludibacteraceae bacterium]